MYAIAQSVENRPPTLQITKAHNYKSQEYYIIRKKVEGQPSNIVFFYIFSFSLNFLAS